MNHSLLGALLWPALCCPLIADASDWHIQDAHIPVGLEPESFERPLVIAIVDDGVRSSDIRLSEFLFENPIEMPGNRIDDDGNGYIDDVYGWDVSDSDPDIQPPLNRLEKFYHGTYLSGIIVESLKKAYGLKANQLVHIMPVKCVSDTSHTLQLDKAYQGIEYAMNNGANIILCAWNLNVITDDEKAILNRAERMGIQIVASSGNIPQQTKQFPAAHPAVLAISAHDQAGVKLSNATYGSFVDLSAPGEEISSFSASGEDQMETHSGTSPAAAIATACMAIVKLQNPEFTWDQIKASLVNASTSTTQNPTYSVTLGAGKINLDNALKNGYKLPANRLYKPKGYIPVNLSNQESWTLGPLQGIKGYRIKALTTGNKEISGQFNFYREEGTRHDSMAGNKLPPEIFIPGNQGRVEFIPSHGSIEGEVLLAYRCDPINYSTLYASGTKYLNKEGTIEDGSQEYVYAPGTDAKWLITAPKGKVVHIEFDEMDTETLVDKIYFFDGNRTNAQIMAIFSGPKIPPELTTWSNQVLVWFVTDGQNQRGGWKFRYTFVDPE